MCCLSPLSDSPLQPAGAVNPANLDRGGRATHGGVNSANGSELEPRGTTDPEPQHKGGEPTPAAGTRRDHGDQADADSAEYAKLLDFYDSSFRNIAEGEVVKGTVLKVTDSEVIVDVGYKSEGIISVQEFVDETGQVAVQPGRHRGCPPGAH